jgi:DNA transposition AAA+ family ATPase
MTQPTLTPTEQAALDLQGSSPIAPEAQGVSARSSWNISTDNLRVVISHCAPEAKKLLVECFLWCTDPRHAITRSEFAGRVGVSDNTLYRILKGKYVHPSSGERLEMPAEMVSGMRGFLATEKARADLGRVRFVLTPTAKKIWNACDLARESQTPVFVLGPSHVGKTWALQEYASRENHGRSPYCRFQAASGLHGMVRRIAEAVGVSPNSNNADLVARIKNAITRDQVLICDETHQLTHTYRKESFFACMEVLREIYDECRCGMVLCGTRILQDKMAESRGELEQLMRRGVHRVVLPDAPLAADVAAVLADWGLSMPKRRDQVTVDGITEQPYELLRQLSRNQGLKAVTERLRYGTKLAGRASSELAWEHVVEAHLLITDASQPTSDWV